MKRIIAALTTATMITVGGGLAVAGGFAIAGASTVPEVDVSGATIQLAETKLAISRCTGQQDISNTETPTPYETLRGSWKGGETDMTSGGTPFSLSGTFVIQRAVWTVNLKTDRGVLKATAELINSAGGVTYKGPMVLITQGLPGSAGAAVTARGWINAATYTNGTATGADYLSNVEFNFGAGYAGNGVFGNTSMGIQDYSVYFNNQVC